MADTTTPETEHERISRTRFERARDEMPTDTYEDLLALALKGEAA